MQYEVYIDMSNENALYTVSMLSAMLEAQDGDYYNLLMPFLLSCLPDNTGSEVNVKDITEKMKEYGFVDFPIKLTETLLGKLCKPWKDGNTYIRQTRAFKKTKYMLATKFDASDFNSSNRDMRYKIERILGAIQEYFVSNFYYEKLELSLIKNKLLAFFEENGFMVIKNTAKLGLIQKENGSDSFEIAHFVLAEYAKHSTIFDDLCDVVKGFLTYKGLYYFLQDRKGDVSAKLRNVTFYLDCSLVLDALNYDTDSDYSAVQELVRLIRRSGGKVCVFEHTVREASKLIYAFANQANNRNNFRLDNLSVKNYSREMLIAYADDIEGTLNKNLSLEVVDAPSFSETMGYKFLLGETEIVNWLVQNRSKGKNNPEVEERYYYDSASLLSVGMIRRSFYPTHIEDAKAMLVTQDLWLNRCLESLYPEKFEKEVPYTITDAELVSLLWLRDHKNETQVPCDMLIANAHAASRVLPDVMKRATELANSMAESGDLPPDAALLVSSHPGFKKYLATAINNDISRLDSGTIRKAVDNFIASSAFVEISKAREEEKEKARKAMTEAAVKSEKDKTELTQTIREKSNELEILRQTIRDNEEKNMRERERQVARLCQRAEENARKMQKYVRKALIACVHITGTFLACVCLVNVILESVQSISSGGFDWVIVVNGIGFFFSVAIFFQRSGWIMRKVNKLADHVYKKVYSQIVGDDLV